MVSTARARQLALCLAVAIAQLGHAVVAEADAPSGRWLAGDPDALIDLSLAAALQGGPDALARTLIIAELADAASAGKASAALETIAAADGAIAGAARWLARGLVPEPSAPWPGLDQLPYDGGGGAALPGLVRAWTLLGPFEDTGGGLERKEGPELSGHRFASADYSWGVYAVHPQRSLVPTVRAAGLPLDLYIHPRRESCSYLSSAITIKSRTPVVMWIATSGSYRALWNGSVVASSQEVHASAKLDRAALEINAEAGEHLLTLKICSGARPDEGRVRVRFSDTRGADLELAASSALSDLDRLAMRNRQQLPKSTFRSLPTSLARSVAPALRREAPTTTEALLAALTLTLSGSDDLSVLRAPGLLDRVAADPDAQFLALAGFASSFGANRSGWLTRALERARIRGDQAAASFSQRLLVLHRLRVGATDLAAATAAEAPLAGEQDVHARFLRAKVVSTLAGRGADSVALGQLRALSQQRGLRTPVAVWRAIAQLAGSGHPTLRLGALQRIAGARPAQRGSRYLSAHALLGADALEQLALAELLQQPSAVELTRVGETLLSSGAYGSAQQVFALVTQLSPNRAAGFRGLSAALRAVSPDAPQGQAVLDALARASELQPNDAETVAELRFRRGEGDDGPKAGADARYIVPAAEFLARAAAKPLTEGVFSRTLHWRRVVRLHPDKRVSQLMHYARQIAVEPRTESERYENLPGGFGTELLVARVHRSDGTVEPPEEQDASGPMVRWPKLKRGDVVEIAVRTWTRGPVGRRGDAPFYFVDYVGATDTRPNLYNEVVIDAPDGSALAFDVVGGAADERRVSRENGHTITHLVWSDPPTIPDEPFAPRVSEMLPVVVGSVYPSWDAFLAWYHGAVEGFTEPDEQIKRLAEELTKGKRSRDDKVQALFNFVADDIRYVNYVSGEWWLPNRPQHLLARRQGDCDDKALLLISLLRAVNIDATEVLIQTRHTAQRRVMRSKRVAIPMFDHGIIYLPNADGAGGRFLDATSPESRIGSLPAMDSGAMALLVKTGQPIIETPESAAKDHGVEARWVLEITPDGGGQLSATETHVGDPAFRLRTHLREQDARAQWVEQNLVSGWFPALEMSPDVSFEGELPSGAAEVRYGATSGSLARREGKELVVSLAPPMPIAGVLAPLLKRTLPVELPAGIAPHHRDMTIEVKAPTGYVFTDLPPDGEEDGGDFGKASLSLTLAPGKRMVTVKRSVALARSRISVADYPRWRLWLQRVDSLLQRSVRLVPR